jgi:hypothetical protein
MAAPLQVDEIAERMRYRVHSEEDPRRIYLVDLLSHGGQGECMCRWWQTTVWPIVRDGGKATCKHIDAARAYFLNGLLAEMSRREAEPATKSTVQDPYGRGDVQQAADW